MKTLDALALVGKLTRRPDEHKGTAGKALLIGGAPTMAGALILAGKSALHSGAGLTLLMMLDQDSSHVVTDQPELMMHDANRYQPVEALRTIKPTVIAIGPGIGLADPAQAWLHASLNWVGPLIIDADALNLLSMNPELLSVLKQRKSPTTLTPHPGEAARLLGWHTDQVQQDREGAIHALVRLTNAIVVLKGHQTLIANPQGESFICMQGNPGMAVGGMGDTLTGCIAGIAAQGMAHEIDLFDATCLAVQLHAMAGDQLVEKQIGPIGLTPSELTIEIRRIINHRLSQCS